MANIKQDQEIEEFLNKGLSFEERLLQAGALIREQSKHAYPYNLLDARVCLLSIYYHLISHWKSSLPDAPGQPIAQRINLILLFFQGADFTESAISEGQYLKAAAMLQQDLEILAQLQELGGESSQNCPLPNIKTGPPGMTRILEQFHGATSKNRFNYSFLTTITPSSSSRITTFPVLNEEAVRGMYELHIRLLFQMVREFMIVYTENYSDRFNSEEFLHASDFLYSVVETLEEIGFRFEKPDNH